MKTSFKDYETHMPRTTAVFINTINQSEHDGEMIGTTTSHLEEHRLKTGLRFPLA
jgi:hypothetical protein